MFCLHCRTWIISLFWWFCGPLGLGGASWFFHFVWFCFTIPCAFTMRFPVFSLLLGFAFFAFPYARVCFLFFVFLLTGIFWNGGGSFFAFCLVKVCSFLLKHNFWLVLTQGVRVNPDVLIINNYPPPARLNCFYPEQCIFSSQMAICAPNFIIVRPLYFLLKKCLIMMLVTFCYYYYYSHYYHYYCYYHYHRFYQYYHCHYYLPLSASTITTITTTHSSPVFSLLSILSGMFRARAKGCCGLRIDV